jgi:hypothetical protein
MSLSGRTGFRRTVAVVAVCVVAAIAAGVALADYNYVDTQTMSPGQSLYSTANSWSVNRVWHPMGTDFCVWFAVSGGNQQAGEQCTTGNPTTTLPGGYGYNVGYCSSAHYSDAYPITCRVYS